MAKSIEIKMINKTASLTTHSYFNLLSSTAVVISKKRQVIKIHGSTSATKE